MKVFNPVGDAHVFPVVEDSLMGTQYGVHLVISNQFMTYANNDFVMDEFELRGTIKEKEIFELSKGSELFAKIPITHANGMDFEFKGDD